MDSTFPSISTFLNNFHVGSEWKFTGWVLFYEFSSLSIQNRMDLLTLYFKIWFSLARDNGRDDNYLEEKMMNEENLMLGIKWKKYLKIVILKAESLGEKKKNKTQQWVWWTSWQQWGQDVPHLDTSQNPFKIRASKWSWRSYSPIFPKPPTQASPVEQITLYFIRITSSPIALW